MTGGLTSAGRSAVADGRAATTGRAEAAGCEAADSHGHGHGR
jgi:hypothetical protein